MSMRKNSKEQYCNVKVWHKGMLETAHDDEGSVRYVRAL